MLKDIFFELASKYADKHIAASLWTEIEYRHSQKGRHYHTLSHLEDLITQLTPFQQEIKDWDVVLFSVFYHDIVYSALKSDNEAESAHLADFRLKTTKLQPERIKACTQQIYATKAHTVTGDHDTDLFTDADLSILGAPAGVYQTYAANVRKEYTVYPDLVYKPGRRKVLQHFLGMERIFKTAQFYARYEQSARKNLQDELLQLI